MQFRTPLLARLQSSFQGYLDSLSKSGRHNFKVTMNANLGREYIRVGFDKDLVSHWMAVWERQEVNGHKPKWIFGPEYFEFQHRRDSLRLFAVTDGENFIGLHPTELHGNLIYSHPPCYDKSHPELARFMWFGLMKWGCENGVEFVDLGGGNNGTWRDCAMSHVDGAFKYKWLYVPKESKDYPQEEPPYIEMRCECGNKQLVIGPEKCGYCHAQAVA